MSIGHIKVEYYIAIKIIKCARVQITIRIKGITLNLGIFLGKEQS